MSDTVSVRLLSNDQGIAKVTSKDWKMLYSPKVVLEERSDRLRKCQGNTNNKWTTANRMDKQVSEDSDYALDSLLHIVKNLWNKRHEFHEFN